MPQIQHAFHTRHIPLSGIQKILTVFSDKYIFYPFIYDWDIRIGMFFGIHTYVARRCFEYVQMAYMRLKLNNESNTMGISWLKFNTAVLLVCLAGCSPVYFQPEDPGMEYRWYIEQWQQRVQQEGWSEALVNDIMDSSLTIAKYEREPANHDHWKSYGEFKKDFRGDCEDIATFMYGTLKRADYPHALKLRIIRMPAGDHAVLMVKLPTDQWKMYNSIPQPGDFLDIALARTVVEWDDQNIYYPQ